MIYSLFFALACQHYCPFQSEETRDSWSSRLHKASIENKERFWVLVIFSWVRCVFAEWRRQCAVSLSGGLPFRPTQKHRLYISFEDLRYYFFPLGFSLLQPVGDFPRPDVPTACLDRQTRLMLCGIPQTQQRAQRRTTHTHIKRSPHLNHWWDWCKGVYWISY